MEESDRELSDDEVESGEPVTPGESAPRRRSFLGRMAQPPEAPLARVTAYYGLLAAALAVLFRLYPELADFFVVSEEELSALGPGSGAFGLEGAPLAAVGQVDTMVRLLVCMLGALALMIPVSWGYMGARRIGGYDQSIARTIVLLPIAVAGIVIIVQHSLALAFSLAGIVAGVRFRNTLKDTGDALYIFASIGVGLAAGISALGVAAAVSVFFNYASLALWKLDYASEGAVVPAKKAKKKAGAKPGRRMKAEL